MINNVLPVSNDRFVEILLGECDTDYALGFNIGDLLIFRNIETNETVETVVSEVIGREIKFEVKGLQGGF